MIPREEENYYAFSLSYSYSYSYDSTNDKGSYEITGHSVTSMPEYSDETNAESETEVLLAIETTSDNNNNSMENISPSDTPDINLEQSSVIEEITTMPTILSVKANENKIENAPSSDTSSTSESNAANATITLLKSEAVSDDSNNMKIMSFFAKTIIGVGIACTAVAALLLYKKNN